MQVRVVKMPYRERIQTLDKSLGPLPPAKQPLSQLAQKIRVIWVAWAPRSPNRSMSDRSAHSRLSSSVFLRSRRTDSSPLVIRSRFPLTMIGLSSRDSPVIRQCFKRGWAGRRDQQPAFNWSQSFAIWQ
jgi:hypothetical protein